MATALSTTAHFRLPMPQQGTYEIEAGRWRLLTEVIFPAARSSASIIMAIDYCRARNLDIMKRPVNIVPVWNSALGREVETIWPSISEIETTAARTGAWAGMDKPELGPIITHTFQGRRKQKDGTWADAKETVTFPEFAAVAVYRLIGGERYAFIEPVFWLESYGRVGGSSLPNDQWKRRPRGMLIKVAKAASLRAAFPEEEGGSPSAEEMSGQEIEGRPEPEPHKWSPPAAVASPPVAAAAQAASAPAAPASAPAATPGAPEPPPPEPADIVDPETGEIIEAKPPEPSAPAQPPPARSLPYPLEAIYDHDGNTDWRAWATGFIALVRVAASPGEVDGWRIENNATLVEMEKVAPKLAIRVRAAVAQREAELNTTILSGG
jgi:phage recombination protein Bet